VLDPTFSGGILTIPGVRAIFLKKAGGGWGMPNAREKDEWRCSDSLNPDQHGGTG
jgi:hypothetical protein